MSELPPSNTHGENVNQSVPYLSPAHEGLGVPIPPPVSKLAVSGLAVAFISLFIFGFMGLIGAVLCWRGLRKIRSGQARGRRLAIAGAAIGVLGFIFYLVSLFVRNS